jgi:hypothetical protein
MFPISPKWANQPILLSGEQIEAPYQVLQEFFDDMKLAEIRQDLANQLETCLVTENTYFAAPWQRADLIHRYNRLVELLEAASLIAHEDRSDWFRIAS